jgi:hypothetical protein
LGLEIGLLDEGELSEIPALRELLTSSAFMRYLDAYLALSVRFVAERLNVVYHPSNGLNELPAGAPVSAAPSRKPG